ncbi:MAG: crossover junction endodeoxyribonuclease RuvC, partial [Frankiaceae bacterium]|nr:crossover junction endodeoxyribonuclease RuvC [Frankiaceae bacterium]
MCGSTPATAPGRSRRCPRCPARSCRRSSTASRPSPPGAEHGQARGAAIVTCRLHNLSIHEYSAKEIKLAVTGYGAASKE